MVSLETTRKTKAKITRGKGTIQRMENGETSGSIDKGDTVVVLIRSAFSSLGE